MHFPPCNRNFERAGGNRRRGRDAPKQKPIVSGSGLRDGGYPLASMLACDAKKRLDVYAETEGRGQPTPRKNRHSGRAASPRNRAIRVPRGSPGLCDGYHRLRASPMPCLADPHAGASQVGAHPRCVVRSAAAVGYWTTYVVRTTGRGITSRHAPVPLDRPGFAA